MTNKNAIRIIAIIYIITVIFVLIFNYNNNINTNNTSELDTSITCITSTISYQSDDLTSLASPYCFPEFAYNKDWTEEEKYLLAKIAMAEAEGCDTGTKSLVMMVVLNRVKSNEFPDTIYDVIFENNQFSPIKDGRWYRVEPNEDCWKALQMIIDSDCDCSMGALYFESTNRADSWHNRNLYFLYETNGMRFYK